MAASTIRQIRIPLGFRFHSLQCSLLKQQPFKLINIIVLSYRTYSGTPSQNTSYDVVVVGGGIVGMATARELALRHSDLKLAVVEKENCLAFHQSGHNSGVIHAGIYYKPGTLKAKLCVEGLRLSYQYCDEKQIPYKKCGKLIVATNETEIERLNELHKRGIANDVPGLKIIERDQIKKIEPFCKGLKALHSPHTGIVDWALVTRSYGLDFEQLGGTVMLQYPVTGFTEGEGEHPVNVHSHSRRVRAKYVLTCGGLQADILSTMSGGSTEPRIVPFRGEYLLLNPSKTHLVQGNIYPVPDPRFPFLGVHFTPRMDGNVWLGPNAVLALKREGYSWTDVNLTELASTLSYKGFRKMAAQYVGFGALETLKSLFPALQVRDLQKFIPDIGYGDVSRGPAGVRAQALSPFGDLVDDFVFDSGTQGVSRRVLHCRNAPSPGATSSLAIAKYIADTFDKQFLV